MLPVKPFNAATETEYVALCPWVTEADPGEAETPKSGTGPTSVPVLACTSDPLVPLIVSVYVPPAVVVVVLTVSVELPGTATEPAENEPVTFDGRPLTARLAV